MAPPSNDSRTSRRGLWSRLRRRCLFGLSLCLVAPALSAQNLTYLYAVNPVDGTFPGTPSVVYTPGPQTALDVIQDIPAIADLTKLTAETSATAASLIELLCPSSWSSDVPSSYSFTFTPPTGVSSYSVPVPGPSYPLFPRTSFVDNYSAPVLTSGLRYSLNVPAAHRVTGANRPVSAGSYVIARFLCALTSTGFTPYFQLLQYSTSICITRDAGNGDGSTVESCPTDADVASSSHWFPYRVPTSTGRVSCNRNYNRHPSYRCRLHFRYVWATTWTSAASPDPLPDFVGTDCPALPTAPSTIVSASYTDGRNPPSLELPTSYQSAQCLSPHGDSTEPNFTLVQHWPASPAPTFLSTPYRTYPLVTHAWAAATATNASGDTTAVTNFFDSPAGVDSADTFPTSFNPRFYNSVSSYTCRPTSTTFAPCVASETDSRVLAESVTFPDLSIPDPQLAAYSLFGSTAVSIPGDMTDETAAKSCPAYWVYGRQTGGAAAPSVFTPGFALQFDISEAASVTATSLSLVLEHPITGHYCTFLRRSTSTPCYDNRCTVRFVPPSSPIARPAYSTPLLGGYVTDLDPTDATVPYPYGSARTFRLYASDDRELVDDYGRLPISRGVVHGSSSYTLNANPLEVFDTITEARSLGDLARSILNTVPHQYIYICDDPPSGEHCDPVSELGVADRLRLLPDEHDHFDPSTLEVRESGYDAFPGDDTAAADAPTPALRDIFVSPGFWDGISGDIEYSDQPVTTTSTFDPRLYTYSSTAPTSVQSFTDAFARLTSYLTLLLTGTQGSAVPGDAPGDEEGDGDGDGDGDEEEEGGGSSIFDCDADDPDLESDFYNFICSDFATGDDPDDDTDETCFDTTYRLANPDLCDGTRFTDYVDRCYSDPEDCTLDVELTQHSVSLVREWQSVFSAFILPGKATLASLRTDSAAPSDLTVPAQAHCSSDPWAHIYSSLPALPTTTTPEDSDDFRTEMEFRLGSLTAIAAHKIYEYPELNALFVALCQLTGARTFTTVEFDFSDLLPGSWTIGGFANVTTPGVTSTDGDVKLVLYDSADADTVGTTSWLLVTIADLCYVLSVVVASWLLLRSMFTR